MTKALRIVVVLCLACSKQPPSPSDRATRTVASVTPVPLEQSTGTSNVPSTEASQTTPPAQPSAMVSGNTTTGGATGSGEKPGSALTKEAARSLLLVLAKNLNCGPGGGCTGCKPLRDILREGVDASRRDDAGVAAAINDIALDVNCPPPGGGPTGPGGGCSNCAPAPSLLKDVWTEVDRKQKLERGATTAGPKQGGGTLPTLAPDAAVQVPQATKPGTGHSVAPR